ncbi:MAG: PHB depolymerase family esterase [Opitutaceae bacterium]|nr:PHB depolymerase family esterase [Opitutaceae bacterium]
MIRSVAPSRPLVNPRLLGFAVAVSLLSFFPGFLHAGETALPDANGLTHWLYTPTENAVAGKAYWLVVGVHGAGGTGKGAAGIAAWATDFDDVIVLGPSFEQPKRDPAGPRPAAMPRDIFQMSGPAHEAKFAELIAQIRKDWNLHPKIFLHGFSAGAQFCHRYAFRHPELVAAVSAHSGGSWARLDGEDRINPAAKHIPFAVSCGEDDQGTGGPLGTPPRIAGARRFTEQLVALGFAVEFKTWPGVGHRQTPEAIALGRALLERVRGKK